MNRQKIVVAGLVAGLVLNVLDFITYSYITGGALKQALDGVNPSLSVAMALPPHWRHAGLALWSLHTTKSISSTR